MAGRTRAIWLETVLIHCIDGLTDLLGLIPENLNVLIRVLVIYKELEEYIKADVTNTKLSSRGPCRAQTLMYPNYDLLTKKHDSIHVTKIVSFV